MLVEFKGVPIEEIAKTMHHTCKTIQRYLSPDYSVEDGHYNARIPGKLAPYEAEVIKLRSEGMTYPNIHKIITEKGYILVLRKTHRSNQRARLGRRWILASL